ncbi:hypothetical protein D3C85_1507450 [compost metagenome]
MRGMRRVSLILVDERRGLVVVEMHIVGSAKRIVFTGLSRDVAGSGQHHKALGCRQIVCTFVDA